MRQQQPREIYVDLTSGNASPFQFNVENVHFVFACILDRVQLGALARAASAALYRRITPVGTAFDGDVIFATARLDGSIAAAPAQVEALAVLALERAIERAVRTRAPGETLQG